MGILVADVSGHGLPSALIASMLKVALAAQSPHAFDPARVLTGLNQSLCGKFQNSFVTAAYVFVDMEKNSMSYAGAAHPPLLLWRASTGDASALAGEWSTTRPILRRNLLCRGGTRSAWRQSRALH